MEIVSKSEKLLGTLVEIKLPKQHSDVFPFCFSEISRIERAFSRFLDDSELSRLNQNLGKWQPASAEIISLIKTAEEIRKKSNGTFDITVKSALDRIGYDKNYSFTPKQEPVLPTIPALASRIFGPINIDEKIGKVLLYREIDFGGFGKGYALDKVASILEQTGISHYYINAGGDIYARRGSGCGPWQILLEHPDDPERAIGTVQLDGQAIAGSAPNRRNWGNGKYHHLLNAKTGKPAEGVKAIFTIAKTGLEADAFSTAIFTAGFGQGIELSKRLPVEILFISSEGKMYQSPGFAAEIFH